MPKGYNDKILHVNLTDEKWHVEEPGLDFYRRYVGGSALGTYYCLKEIPKGVDPLGAENVIAFSGSIITGAPVPFLSRISITSKSPITGGIGDSQAGGWFAPEMKFAGFDAIIVKGKAKKPVYLWISNGKVEIRDACHLWGQDIGDAESSIREEVQEKNARVIGIGKAGENRVSYACIINERRHAAGRTGMGAVMGSKNLKAIAVKGNKNNLEYENPEELRALVKEDVEFIKNDPATQSLSKIGTNDAYIAQNEMGGLPTRNFKTGVFKDYLELAPDKMHELYHKNESCYACPVRCKITLKASKPYDIDPSYGGPEYETVSSLGSYLCNSNKYVLAKAHELCNRYTIDTISLGASIAFGMECYENGLITKVETDGLELSFGNSEVILPLIEKIANCEKGIGELLAKGPKKAAEIIGRGSEKYAIEVKGNPLPAHMPRQKHSMAVIYAVNPYGADHCSSLADFIYFNELPEEARGLMRMMDLNTFGEYDGITTTKTRMILYSQKYFSFIDSIGICLFSTFAMNFDKISKYIKAITGWDTSIFEFMKIGERKINMMKYFNYREGFTIQDDYIPERLFEEIPNGPTEGQKIDRDEFNKAILDYYDMAGWDIEESKPTKGKLKELDLEWVI